jgi:hypothetical protein
MEAFMRILVSVIALAVALAWPSAGEAQSKKSTARSKATAKHYVQRPAKVAKRGATQRQRSAAQRPCAGYLWWGCVGWDPDPNVRSSLVRDLSEDP